MKTTTRGDLVAHIDLSPRFGGSAGTAPSQRSDTVRIHLLHPCPMLRIGMAAILAAQPGFAVVDKPMPFEAIDAACIVITDYAAGMQTIGQRDPVRRGPAPKILIVTHRAKEWDVRQALDSGVHGYLLQSCIPDELIRSVHMLSRGLGYLSSDLKPGAADSLHWEALTRRETDVLRLLACGDSNKTIANELGIGVVTVKTHVGQLMQKLNATTRTHVVAVALSRGLLQPGTDAGATRRLTGL